MRPPQVRRKTVGKNDGKAIYFKRAVFPHETKFQSRVMSSHARPQAAAPHTAQSQAGQRKRRREPP